MSRLRDEKGRFLKNPPKTALTGASLLKGFSTVGSSKMSEEETSKGPTAEQRREYERMLEIENKRRQERRDQERRHEREEERGHEREEKVEEDQEATFKFPILDTSIILGEDVKMKNIPPSVLPNFYGLTSEDPDSFLFEFDILCRTYGYTDDTHKLCLFPATLKEAALKWFMGLGEHSITSWDEMRKIFLQKYQAYCRSKDLKDDIFGMTQ